MDINGLNNYECSLVGTCGEEMMNAEARVSAISLSLDDVQRLAAAEGYIELDLYEEALEEIQQTSALCQKLPFVQTLELCICAGLSKRPSPVAPRQKLGSRNRRSRATRTCHR